MDSGKIIKTNMIYIRRINAILMCLFFLSSVTSAQQYSNPVGNKFPIVAWYSVETGYITKQEYKQIGKAGFNLSLSSFLTKDETLKALHVAKGTGVKLIIDCQEARNANANFIEQIRAEKMLGLYYLRDEPAVDYFETLQERSGIINTVDKSHYPYINLLPIYANSEQMKADTYEQYLKTFIDVVHPFFLSFDHYPFVRDYCRSDFYDNLYVVHKVCEDNKIPFWGFVRTLEDSNYKFIDEGRLRLQVYSNLSYGAQGLQYFTYSIPEGCKAAIVDKQHRTTELYLIVANINKEIQRLAKYYLGNKVTGIFHTDGKERNLGIMPELLLNIITDGKGLLLTSFVKNKHQYLLVVNKDYEKSQKTILCFKNKVAAITKKGHIQKRRICHEITIEAGDGVLFQLM